MSKQTFLLENVRPNKNKNRKMHLPLTVIDFISGFVGGAAQVIVAQPFDTIKVKQQTFPKLYKNMIDCFWKTYQNEGITHGLYSGTVPALAASIGESSVLFAAYGKCRKFVAFLMGIENDENLPLFGEALAGSFGSFFSSFALCPTELVKCKMQAINEIRLVTNERNGVLPQVTVRKILRDIYVTDGIKGFYRGFGTTLVREMPGYFLFFGFYEGLRELFTKPGKTKDDIGPLATILAGGLGGTLPWGFIFPVDVIKSRIQINDLSSGMLQVGKEIVRDEGVLALYNGLLPTVIRTAPAMATLFLCYEFTKKTLKNNFNID